MESCILCLEINKNFVDSIKTNSAKWQENQIAELIEKHFWPLNSLLTSLNSALCLPCWQELDNFHKFYMRIEEAHINFGRLIKVGDTTQILDTDKGVDNEDNKEGIPYGLLEPEILIDKPPETDESEILCTAVKTEPQDESFTDVLNEPKSMPLKMNNNPSNKDDLLENPIEPKRISAKSKRKIERKNTNKTSCKVTKAEKLEIKMENCNNDDSDENDNYEAIKKHDDDSSDSENSSDNNNDQQADSDSPHSTEHKKRKNYYKHRTNRKENDQFIAKHLKDIACDLCKTSFESFGALRHHFTEIHKRRGYVICCSKKFCNRTLLVDHIHTHLNPDHFKCTKCDRVLPDRLRLESHMLRLHEVTELEKKRCDVCQKPFIDGYSLRIHKLTHLPEDQKKFPCKECGKIYANSYLLKAHTEAVHLKKFVKICYICGKSIATSADYKLHMNKHEGIPPPEISCDVCGLKLASERNLKRHKESQHPVGGKQEHPCPVCPKVSPTLRALKKHMSTMHEKGCDHKCNMCEKAFRRADALREHMATHTGTALYTCAWCPKTFNSNANMHAHRKKMHPKEWKEDHLKKYSNVIPQQSESSN